MIDYEYHPHEQLAFMLMELGDRSLRDLLEGLPLNDGLRRTIWRQIVVMLKALEDARIGE